MGAANAHQWPEGQPYEERGGKVLLWPVAQAVPSGKDTQFPANANTTGAKVADALESNSSVAHQRQRLHRIWRCVILEPDLAYGGVGSEFEELASPALSGSPAGSSAIDGGDQHRNRAVHRDANTGRMYLHSVTTKENLRDGQVNPGPAPIASSIRPRLAHLVAASNSARQKVTSGQEFQSLAQAAHASNARRLLNHAGTSRMQSLCLGFPAH
jgi:hypothetical protein